MKATFTIARREVQSYFNSPTAYIVLSVFLLIVGYLYFATFFLAGVASMRNFFSLVPVFFVVFAPAISMRLIAEERKSGTIEPLLTLPASDTEVVVGKFLSALFVIFIGLCCTIPFVLTVAAVALPGLSVDYGPIVGGYVGLLLLASAFLAMGILASALTQNQIVAFILGLLLCFFFFLIDKVAILFPASVSGVFEYLSVDTHFANIARGVIDTRDIVYYLSLTASALYFSVRALRKP